MNMQEKVLGWIGRDSPLVADNIIPPVAMMPEAKPITDEDKRLAVIAQAHIHVEQLRQEREADRAEIERLQAELAEVFKALQAEKRKSGLLELDIAQHVNTIATLQTDLNDKGGFLNTLKDINDKTTAAFARLDIKGAAKKVRTPRPKKKSVPGNRESADQTAKADG